jgi:hypothetical protein
MDNVIVLGLPTEEKKVANAGLATDALINATGIEVQFLSRWEKDGKTRVGKDGKGFVGGKTSIGFMNISLLLTKWDEQGQIPQGLFAPVNEDNWVTPVINGVQQAPVNQPVLKGYNLVCNPAITYKISGDAKGKITKIEL